MNNPQTVLMAENVGQFAYDCTNYNNTTAAAFSRCAVRAIKSADRASCQTTTTPQSCTNRHDRKHPNTSADLQCAVRDVVDVHGENVVLAAHVHPVLVLVHVQDPVVHWLVPYTVVFEGLGGLQV